MLLGCRRSRQSKRLTPTTVCLPRVDARLASVRRPLRCAAWEGPASIALVMPPSSSTSWIMLPGLVGELVGSAVRRSSCRPRDRPRRTMSVSCCRKQLGVAGDAGREVGRQGERLVQCVRVQRLGVPDGRRPSPPRRCGRRCCRRPGRSATSPRSGECVRSDRDFGFLGSNSGLMILAHSIRAARSLATSMK